MGRYNTDKRDLTASEIFDRFGVGYYEMLIDECQTRIMNIRAGEGDKSDTFTYREDSSFKSIRDKERKIEELGKQIQKYSQIIKEINEAIYTVNSGIAVLEQAAETHALLAGLNDSLAKCFLKFEEKQNQQDSSVRIPSDTYDAIYKNKFFEKAKSKYRRLLSKEYRTVDKETRKIKKEIYKKLKTIYNRSVVDMSERHRYSYRHKERYDYVSLNGALKDNHQSLDGFAYNLYRDMSEQYHAYDPKTLAPLGVEVQKLKRAYDISNGKERMFDEFGPILKSMDYLSNEYYVYRRFKTFFILKEKIEVVNKLSIEVECLDLIIDAYDGTLLKETDMFKELIEIYRKQNKKLQDLSRKATEMYNKSGLKEYIEFEKRLRELHRQSTGYRHRLALNEEKLGYSHPETRKASDLYVSTKSEMLGILLKYPELNRSEYGIDLSKYDSKGNEIEPTPEKKEIPERVVPVSTHEEEPIIPTRVVTEEELRDDLGMTEAPVTDGKKAWEPAEPEEENNFEVPDYLTAIRTAYYSRYMVEKVRGSELGKMKFSEYLENVAPEHTELIEIEQRRELRAKNVFKLYVQYLASLDDKSQAMRFSEFARLRHGLEQEDLPHEYSDEEVKKRLSV